MFELRQVSKSYGSVQALHPLDFVLEKGKTTVLIGPSGCGKSTLLRLLVGLILPDAGEMRFEGEPIRRSDWQQIRRRIGYVIQEGGLFPHLTAQQNVELMAGYLGKNDSEMRSRINELAAMTRLAEEAIEKYPSQLSGGQRQRVSLMRALMLDPDVLLLDEPLGALDPMVRAELQRDLREIFRSLGKTVVIVTHDLAEAEYFADRIVLLRDGRIEQSGPAKELTGTPANEFVREFVSAQRAVHSNEPQGANS
ncbi:ATP-binding cassette domain-containing protein [Stratiformator vulcanicus]|uniref:Glycine betaine/carnitine/choline transport ATP-binding protein OpuCA n=1 Tax=Stratiformator vulcanicus TaxID=2527980 RepID=A0A517R092_9PLAN|nr:ATP-binding cassette domain-containing protein [Stratiformator vulcanicus]QDT37301.1 Glycine betaine/carnitine/choline transport ATP-binding protein OpuCA [Stratiformator vulcanicus]